MKRILYMAVAGACAAGLAACGSTNSGTHPTSVSSVARVSGTEVIRAAITGAKAAKDIGSNSNAPLVFPSAQFSGPVTTRMAPFKLGGKGKRHAFVTPAGDLAVIHIKDKHQQKNPVVTGQDGRVCYFSQVWEAGTWKAVPARSTGKFAGATGAGTYTITATVAANLLKGKSKCSAANTGKAIPPASLVFVVTGPLTVK